VNTDISFIPHSLDEVAVACADRSLLTDKKAVFIIGAIDTEFPNAPVESGLYSDTEREILSTFNIELSDSVSELVPTEKYLAYKALTSASDKLFVSYHSFTLNGEKKSPSVIFDEISDIFNDTKMLDNLITYLDGRKDLLEEIKSTYISWLKSLKDRIGG
jgi:ATP-dependent helicase/nuclease subunit B